MRSAICSTLSLVAVLLPASAWALAFPITRSDDHWTPTRAVEVGITSLRLDLYPARAADSDLVVWWADETMVVRNHGAEVRVLELAVPNAWSSRDASVAGEAVDFWVEVYVNGRPVETALTRLVANPAHASVTFRSARHFRVRLEAGESAHVRVLFALPLDRASDEQRLSFPFHLRTLWSGPIEAGVIVLRWSDQLYGLRSNLPAYAQYRDRVEWFVRGFEPTTDLDVRFLTRATVFEMVAARYGCPRPWELVDRVADGDPSIVRHMLATYRDDQLDLCAQVPAALRGSLIAADRSGLTNLDLEQFVPEGMDVSGPLVIPDPAYSDDDLTESERLYGRFLRQELEQRRTELAP